MQALAERDRLIGRVGEDEAVNFVHADEIELLHATGGAIQVDAVIFHAFPAVDVEGADFEKWSCRLGGGDPNKLRSFGRPG